MKIKLLRQLRFYDLQAGAGHYQVTVKGDNEVLGIQELEGERKFIAKGTDEFDSVEKLMLNHLKQD